MTEGVTDDSFVEIKDGESYLGKQAVIGYQTATTLAAAGDEASNPFMPKPPKHGTAGTAPEPKAKAK